VVAAIVAILFVLIAVALLFAMVEVSDLPRCEDRAAVLASDEDDCIEGSAAREAIGLVLGWAATVLAVLAAMLGLLYASGRRRGLALAECALATPLLALGALVLLPVSF
jgi:hypothetical protein